IDNTRDGGKYYAYYTGRNYKVFQPTGSVMSLPGNGENTAVYTPTIRVPGYYEIFEWHGYKGGSPGAEKEATNVPYTIFSSDGDTVVYVDQSKNPGSWNTFGRYFFQAGRNGNVKISNKANGVVLADAISFVYRGSDPSKESTVDRTPPSAPAGVNVHKN
ncbi:MAG: hypothetical protein ACE5I1_18660, partial [bacterium]